MSFFYLLSKIFNFFLHPLHWIYILAVIVLVAKNKKLRKRCGIAALAIFFLFTNQALLNVVVNNWQPQPTQLAKQYSAGIVLGGMSVVDKNNQGYLWQPADRFVKTVQLYHQGTIQKIVVTGGSLFYEKPKEADFVKAELMKCGIPAVDIITESKSANTFENAAFTKRILDSAGLKSPYVLITSAMHIPRAERVFKKAGMPVVAYPSNYEVVKEKLTPDDFFFPKLRLMDIWGRFFKEVTGIWIYRLTGKA